MPNSLRALTGLTPKLRREVKDPRMNEELFRCLRAPHYACRRGQCGYRTGVHHRQPITTCGPSLTWTRPAPVTCASAPTVPVDSLGRIPALHPPHSA